MVNDRSNSLKKLSNSRSPFNYLVVNGHHNVYPPFSHYMAVVYTTFITANRRQSLLMWSNVEHATWVKTLHRTRNNPIATLDKPDGSVFLPNQTEHHPLQLSPVAWNDRTASAARIGTFGLFACWLGAPFFPILAIQSHAIPPLFLFPIVMEDVHALAYLLGRGEY